MIASLLAGAAAGSLGLGLALPQRPGARQQGAPSFSRILWLHSGRQRDAGFYEGAKRLGFTAVSLSAGEDSALPVRHGLRFYLDQACGKGILELRQKQWEPVVRAYSGSRSHKDLMRPACLSSSETLLRLSGKLGASLALVLDQRPLAVSLGDEISVTRHANPLDLCFAPATLRALRSFLRHRHGRIEALNKAWGTEFRSFDEVLPFTADEIRQRELGGKLLPANLRPWAEHREFMDAELARVLRRLVEQVARQDPDLPCGLTGIQQPSAYGGHDYRRLLPLFGFYEVYDIGGARDLAMCLAPEGSRQVATLFSPQEGDPGLLLGARLADFLAHGLSAVVVYSGHHVLDSSGEPTSFGKGVGAALARLRPAFEAFGGARLERSAVWLVESQASVRMHWILDSAGDGKTWIRRLSSYERNHSTSLAVRHSWLRLLEDLGLQARLVPGEDLPRLLEEGAPGLLVLPGLWAISKASVRAIESFVRAGGTAVADHSLGFYDEHLRLRQEPILDRFFGVKGRSRARARQLVCQGRPAPSARLPTGAAAAELGLAGKVSDPMGGFAVQLERQQGKGRSIYLNLAVCEYGGVRLDPKQLPAALDLRRRLRWVIRRAGVKPPVLLQAEGMPTCLERMILRGRDGRRLLAVRVNALDAPELLARLAAKGKRKLHLVFRRPTALRDLLTGIKHQAAREHDLDFTPGLGLFLVLEAGS